MNCQAPTKTTRRAGAPVEVPRCCRPEASGPISGSRRSSGRAGPARAWRRRWPTAAAGRRRPRTARPGCAAARPPRRRAACSAGSGRPSRARSAAGSARRPGEFRVVDQPGPVVQAGRGRGAEAVPLGEGEHRDRQRHDREEGEEQDAGQRPAEAGTADVPTAVFRPPRGFTAECGGTCLLDGLHGLDERVGVDLPSNNLLQLGVQRGGVLGLQCLVPREREGGRLLDQVVLELRVLAGWATLLSIEAVLVVVGRLPMATRALTNSC